MKILIWMVLSKNLLNSYNILIMQYKVNYLLTTTISSKKEGGTGGKLQAKTATRWHGGDPQLFALNFSLKSIKRCLLS